MAKRGLSSEEIAMIDDNERARELGYSYGEYKSYLRATGKEPPKRETVERQPGDVNFWWK